MPAPSRQEPATDSTAPTPVERPGEHHRNVQTGAARAAVFGTSDGLLSNVALILGVAGAQPAPGVVRLAGLAGLVAGAFSMAAGEYVSMSAHAELLERELEMERIEIERRPDHERRELAQIYRNKGVDGDVADQLATEIMRDPEVALETHAREELGIDPGELGSPVRSALSSFVAFAIGAVVPLLPWFFASGNAAVVLSLGAALAGAVGLGSALAWFTGRSWLKIVGRQVLIAAAAAGVTYAVGSAVGVGAGAVT